MSGSINGASDAYTKAFTKIYPKLAERSPVYAQLRNCIDMAVAAAYMQQNDFYGLTTSFRRDRLKPGVVVLAEEEGAPWVKYIHGNFGKGTWTFLGGHDPEDPQHQIGDAPTDLALHPHSPGYRLILNNVLFPAARKKTLKT